MKIFRFIIAPLLLATMLVPAGAFLAPQTARAGAWDTGTNFGGPTCSGGTCSLPRAGNPSGAGSTITNAVTSGTKAASGPTATTPGWGDKVDITNRFIGVGSPVLNAMAASLATLTGQSLFEWGQTFVLEALKKRILDMIVAEIIRWIQGGEEPRFVTNWESYLQEAGNIAAGEFAKELGAGFLCEPFAKQVQLIMTPRTGSESSYSRKAACTLDTIVDNFENFYKDFEEGGWVGYQEAWEPQNNIWGSLLMAREEQRRRIASAQNAAQNEALIGGGFLSLKSCQEATGGTGPDLDKDGIKGDIPSTCSIVTPGSVVEELANKAITADIDFVINANQLSTYLAAIADAAFNRLIRDGVAGLKGLSTNAAPRGGSIPDGPTNCSSFPVDSDLFKACDAYAESNGRDFEGARRGILGDIANAKEKYVIARDILGTTIINSTEFLDFLDRKSSRCVDQALIDKVTLKITELQSNLTTIATIIANLDAAVPAINGIASGDWAELTKIVNTIDAIIDFLAASDVAEAANDQLEAINNEISLTERELQTCF